MKRFFTEIYFDLDGVLADLIKKVVELYNQEFSPQPPLQVEDVRSWGFKEIPLDRRHFVFGLFSKEGFFSSLDPIAGALKGFNFFYQNFTEETRIMTSAPHHNPQSFGDKLIWIKDRISLFPLKRVIANTDKYTNAHPRAILVDDYAENLVKFAERGGISICFDAPYNQDLEPSQRIIRVKGWEALVRAFCVYDVTGQLPNYQDKVWSWMPKFCLDRHLERMKSLQLEQGKKGSK